MPFYLWSETSSSNATADPTINYAEGQAPSSLNDSARAAMARLREWGNDIAGAIGTSGTSTAYTVASNQVFDTLAHLDGQIIAFSPHTTNDATVTLSVDGLTAKPLRSAPSTELLAGTIIEGTPYVAIYNNADGAFYLQGFYGNPYNIPLGAGLDFWGSTAPNSSFVFPVGQAISRTTYSALFALVGTTYGTGDGSTTFNLPDKRGRVSAALDNLGGTAASRLSTYTSLGTSGGEAAHTLTAAELPASIPASASVTLSPSNQVASTASVGVSTPGTQSALVPAGGSLTASASVSVGGSGSSHNNVQPTIGCAYIMRII